MIFCVVPEGMSELVEQLTQYYADDPNVKVIVDRRSASRRDRGAKSSDERRIVRDRRRSRVPGEFPPIDLAPASG